MTLDPARRRALGYGLIAFGLLTIVVAVIAVLEYANGPGTGPKAFAQRRGYDQVKESVHRTFPIAFLVGLGGLGLAIVGKRVASSADRESRPSA